MQSHRRFSIKVSKSFLTHRKYVCDEISYEELNCQVRSQVVENCKLVKICRIIKYREKFKEIKRRLNSKLSSAQPQSIVYCLYL